jgi:hypothetical protein
MSEKRGLLMVYIAISIAVVNVLAVVVVARLGRRLSGTMDPPRRHVIRVRRAHANRLGAARSALPTQSGGSSGLGREA